MLSVSSLKTGQHNYYVELVRLNYYTDGGEPPGLWAGSAAKEFGLEPGSKVDALHLERLCGGFDPHTGKALVQNAGKMLGDCRAPRKPGDDCTLSMPKGASIIWACGSNELRTAIDEMALQAAKRVIAFLEDHCGFCRVGKGGQAHERGTDALRDLSPVNLSRIRSAAPLAYALNQHNPQGRRPCAGAGFHPRLPLQDGNWCPVPGGPGRRVSETGL